MPSPGKKEPTPPRRRLPTRSTILVTPLADRFTSPIITTQTKRKLSSFSRKNGAVKRIPTPPRSASGTVFYRDPKLAPAGAPIFPDCPASGPGGSANSFVGFPNNTVTIDPVGQEAGQSG